MTILSELDVAEEAQIATIVPQSSIERQASTLRTIEMSTNTAFSLSAASYSLNSLRDKDTRAFHIAKCPLSERRVEPRVELLPAEEP